MSTPGFEMDVKLASNADGNILTPFSIPDYSELASGKTNNKDHVVFEINIRRNKLDKLTVKISTAKGVIYQEAIDASRHAIGKHTWQWDGFDTKGVFDTKILKEPLKVEFEATLGGAKKSKTITLKNTHAEQKWLDVAIDKKSKTVAVEIRINVKDGGARGVGEFPPDEVQNDPFYKRLPATDPRTHKHVRLKSYGDLKALTLAGFQRYWSRKITLKSGDTYNVSVTPKIVTKDAMDDISLVYNTNREWLVSSNPGQVRGFYSFFGNFVPERITYNTGWIKSNAKWRHHSMSVSDNEFRETAAHEIGHEILSTYGGSAYSYSHRNSSTIMTQKPKSVKKGGLSYPTSGEIDLMKYYNGYAPRNFYSRVIASEQDVKSLLWIARIKFRD